MTFEELHKQYIVEKEKEVEQVPWSLEITNNAEKPPLYNLLGEMIIKLAELRSRIN